MDVLIFVMLYVMLLQQQGYLGGRSPLRIDTVHRFGCFGYVWRKASRGTSQSGCVGCFKVVGKG